MRLTEASVVIRPRTAWEAVDLGVLLARRHAGLLISSWALITLPLFTLLSLLFWQIPMCALLVFWWLKPAFERLPLYILSHALFADVPSVKTALRALPALLKPQLLASLTWRRFSPTRSFDLPVLQLEGLGGTTRDQRLVVLGQRDAATASWLTILGLFLEAALWSGLLSLFYLLLPQQLEIDWRWQNLFTDQSSEWLWLEHLSNLFYALLLCVWEPIYVASGFSLYLNRRTVLEAWDIELMFRRLRQRLTGSAAALLIGIALIIGAAPSPALAAEKARSSCPLPKPEDPFGPNAERLQLQALSSKAAQGSIELILDQPPFENRETVTRWRLGDEADKSDTDEEQARAWGKAFKNFFKLIDGHLGWLALLVETLLWSALFCVLAALIWRYSDWLRTFAGRLGLPQRRRKPQPLQQLFGLDLAPQSLPDDIAGSAEQLWREQPREALGLLYRGLLSRLLHDFQLPLKSAHTEGEVLQLIEQIEQQELSRFSAQLTRDWQNLAYGHRLPPEAIRQILCDDWRRLFNQSNPA